MRNHTRKVYYVDQNDTDPRWTGLRNKCDFTASEAGALFGFSTSTSQTAFIQQKRGGKKPPLSDIARRILDQGKEDEAFANMAFIKAFNKHANSKLFTTLNGWFWEETLKLDENKTLRIGASPDRFLSLRAKGLLFPLACIEYKTCQKITYKDYLPEDEPEMSWVLQNVVQQFCTGIYLGYVFYYNRNTDGYVLWSIDLQGGDFDKVWAQLMPTIRTVWSFIEKPGDAIPRVTPTQKKAITAILKPYIKQLCRDVGRPIGEDSQEGEEESD